MIAPTARSQERHARAIHVQRAVIGFAIVWALVIGLSFLAERASAQDGANQGTMTFEASALDVEDFVGTMEIKVGSPGTITVTPTGPKAERLMVERKGDTVVIDGGKSSRELRGMNRWFGGDWGNVDLDDYPAVVVTVPDGAGIEIDEMYGALRVADTNGPLVLERVAIDARVGAVQTAKIGVAGSGSIAVASIAEDLTIAIAGSGDVTTGKAGGEVTMSIAGSGSIGVASVGEALGVSISGSGDVKVGTVSSAVKIAINGSGGVRVDDGRADPLKVAINGSGDFVFGGTAVNPRIAVNGSGDVRLGAMEGKLRSSGNGDITIGED